MVVRAELELALQPRPKTRVHLRGHLYVWASSAGKVRMQISRWCGSLARRQYVQLFIYVSMLVVLLLVQYVVLVVSMHIATAGGSGVGPL